MTEAGDMPVGGVVAATAEDVVSGGAGKSGGVIQKRQSHRGHRAGCIAMRSRFLHCGQSALMSLDAICEPVLGLICRRRLVKLLEMAQRCYGIAD